jgi:hypothetical protein
LLHGWRVPPPHFFPLVFLMYQLDENWVTIKT